MDYKETLSNLKFISRIKPEEKINVKYMYVQQDGFFTKISRTIYFETRQSTLNFIENTINSAFEVLNRYKTSDLSNKHKHEFGLQMHKNMLDDIRLCKNGIKNLKETYVSDRKYCCDLDTILENIDSRLPSLSNHIEII